MTKAYKFIESRFSGKSDNFQLTRYMFADCLTDFANQKTIVVDSDKVTELKEIKESIAISNEDIKYGESICVYCGDRTSTAQHEIGRCGCSKKVYEYTQALNNPEQNITVEEHRKRLIEANKKLREGTEFEDRVDEFATELQQVKDLNDEFEKKMLEDAKLIHKQQGVNRELKEQLKQKDEVIEKIKSVMKKESTLSSLKVIKIKELLKSINQDTFKKASK